MPISHANVATRPGAVPDRPPVGELAPALNVVTLVGTLSRPADTRVLPSGDVLVAYEVTVASDGTGPAESVPVVWSSPPVWATELDAGTSVVVVGRVRRRYFRAGGATASRTEVVAERVLPGRQRTRAARAVREAAERLVVAAGGVAPGPAG